MSDRNAGRGKSKTVFHTIVNIFVHPSWSGLSAILAILIALGTITTAARRYLHPEPSAGDAIRSNSINISNNSAPVEVQTGEDRSASKNPCARVADLNMNCTADSLAAAIQSGNIDVAKLIVDGGVTIDAHSDRDSVYQTGVELALSAATLPVQIAVLIEMKKQGMTADAGKTCHPLGLASNLLTNSRAGCALALRSRLYCGFKAAGMDDAAFAQLVVSQTLAEMKANVARYAAAVDSRQCESAQLVQSSRYRDLPQCAGNMECTQRECLDDIAVSQRYSSQPSPAPTDTSMKGVLRVDCSS